MLLDNNKFEQQNNGITKYSITDVPVERSFLKSNRNLIYSTLALTLMNIGGCKNDNVHDVFTNNITTEEIQEEELNKIFFIKENVDGSKTFYSNGSYYLEEKDGSVFTFKGLNAFLYLDRYKEGETLIRTKEESLYYKNDFGSLQDCFIIKEDGDVLLDINRWVSVKSILKKYGSDFVYKGVKLKDYL